MSDKAQRTEKPTPQKLRKAKRDGQVPRTAELSGWTAVLLASVLLPWLVGGLGELVGQLLQAVREVVLDPRPERGVQALREAGVDAVWLLMPFFGAMVVAALVSNAVQGGLRVYPGKFKPKFSVLNPGKGLKQLFSVKAAWTFAKTLLKFVVFGWVAYLELRDVAMLMTTSGAWSLGAAASAAVGAAIHVLRIVAAVGLVLAAADYAVERRRIATSLKMKPEEVKREHKQTEGDPFLKGMMRGKQRAMSRNRMLADLPSADVCCGFGGTFAVKNADTSTAMLADKMAAVRTTRAEVVTAGDASCLMHIAGGLSRLRAGVRPVHLAEILASTGGPS